MQKELETSYEIEVFEKNSHRFIDSYFTYSDDKSTALDQEINHFKINIKLVIIIL